mgnify:FL=1
MKKIAIAIDGPAAAGKSTIAKKVAQILNYTYIDTGAMYRCVAYYLLSQKQDLDDESKIASKLENIHIELLPQGQVLLNGTDVSEQIRQDEVSKNASKVAAYQAVRAYLVDLQRKMATKGGVILDGRDIGSVVLPKAELKIYQVASVETRAKRRYEENQKRGIISSLEQIKQDIEQRDYNDMHRKNSPLVKAEDAIEIDTSSLTIDEVTQKILELVEKRLEE